MDVAEKISDEFVSHTGPSPSMRIKQFQAYPPNHLPSLPQPLRRIESDPHVQDPEGKSGTEPKEISVA